MRVAVLTTDNREHFREYDKTVPWFGTAPEALLQGLTALPDVEVHVVSCTKRGMESPSKLADNIWFHSLVVPHIGWMRTAYQGCIRAVRKKLRELQPDIVHGQGTERDCAISAVFSGYANVLTIHGNMRLIARVNQSKVFSYQWLAARLERFTIPRSNGVVCITHYTQEAMTGLAKRTWVVPNGVDASFFEIHAEGVKAPIILCVGDVSFRKNLNEFIHALDPLAAKRRFRLVLLGRAGKGDPYTDEFFRLLNSRPWCSYEGFASREKLKGYYRRATILALPSKEDNCPMAVLEAMAAGVPVVAARVGGVPDLIEDGKTGLFCDPLEETSMRSAVGRMLADSELCQSLAREAKRRAMERFHPLAVARRHLEIYREVVGLWGE